jgi:hypothetical protein
MYANGACREGIPFGGARTANGVCIYTDSPAIGHAKSFGGTHFMDTSTKTALVIAFVVIALLLLLFGGGMATGTMMSGGMMGSGSMGGISWMWLPTLLVVVLGVVLYSVMSGKK